MPATTETAGALVQGAPAPETPAPETPVSPADAAPEAVADIAAEAVAPPGPLLDGQLPVRVLRAFRLNGETVLKDAELRLPRSLALELAAVFKVEILG